MLTDVTSRILARPTYLIRFWLVLVLWGFGAYLLSYALYDQKQDDSTLKVVLLWVLVLVGLGVEGFTCWQLFIGTPPTTDVDVPFAGLKVPLDALNRSLLSIHVVLAFVCFFGVVYAVTISKALLPLPDALQGSLKTLQDLFTHSSSSSSYSSSSTSPPPPSSPLSSTSAPPP